MNGNDMTLEVAKAMADTSFATKIYYSRLFNICIAFS